MSDDIDIARRTRYVLTDKDIADRARMEERFAGREKVKISAELDFPAYNDTMRINGVEYHRTLKEPVRDGRCNRCLCPAQSGRAFCSPKCEMDWVQNTNKASGDQHENIKD